MYPTFVSPILEKVVVSRLKYHLPENGIVEPLQCALINKKYHSVV